MNETLTNLTNGAHTIMGQVLKFGGCTLVHLTSVWVCDETGDDAIQTTRIKACTAMEQRPSLMSRKALAASTGAAAKPDGLFSLPGFLYDLYIRTLRLSRLVKLMQLLSN
jgi:hypothetical protein